MLTRGAHFAAAARKLREVFGDVPVIGCFIARTVKTQIRGNRLPVLTSGHPLHPQIRTFTDLTMRTFKSQSPCGMQTNLRTSENPQPVERATFRHWQWIARFNPLPRA
ncbi:hypothetical protein QFZ94_000280 [Paraburkholderia sp. JPY465]|uniref:hypothetical protein n=1 Tax=Paraburkholderia sp. JPY465 TaxID=3042285 RepID=UPI003D19D6A6